MLDKKKGGWGWMIFKAVTMPVPGPASDSYVLKGTPTNDDVGDHPVVLTAKDSNDGVITQEFTITVANVNDDPTGAVTITGVV